MSARYAQQKIESAIDLITEFQSRTFPHQDSHEAIGVLASQLNEFRELLRKDTSEKAQTHAVVLISEVLDLLGVIGNSANVRNAFEVHGPFLSLAQQLLRDNAARLILTFEWQYIPYTYPQNYQHLPQFIVIGLPASEGANALVLPAIGHELGHSLWRKENLNLKFKPDIEKEISSTIEGRYRKEFRSHYSVGPDDAKSKIARATRAREHAIDISLQQLQEFFCDFVGLFIFGQAYLDCFDYLLSPNQSNERDPQYPAVRERDRALVRNMSKLSLAAPKLFETRFAMQAYPFEKSDAAALSLRLSDGASSKLANQAANAAFKFCKQSGLVTPKSVDASRILKEFEEGVPAENARSLGAILNAAWRAFKSARFLPTRLDHERVAFLNELVLKSMEILEIEGFLIHASQAKHDKGRTPRTRKIQE